MKLIKPEGISDRSWERLQKAYGSWAVAIFFQCHYYTALAGNASFREADHYIVERVKVDPLCPKRIAMALLYTLTAIESFDEMDLSMERGAFPEMVEVAKGSAPVSLLEVSPLVEELLGLSRGTLSSQLIDLALKHLVKKEKVYVTSDGSLQVEPKSDGRDKPRNNRFYTYYEKAQKMIDQKEPELALSAIRSSLESLVKQLCAQHSIPFDTRDATLETMINDLYENGVISRKDLDLMHSVRIESNKGTHVDLFADDISVGTAQRTLLQLGNLLSRLSSKVAFKVGDRKEFMQAIRRARIKQSKSFVRHYKIPIVIATALLILIVISSVINRSIENRKALEYPTALEVSAQECYEEGITRRDKTNFWLRDKTLIGAYLISESGEQTIRDTELRIYLSEDYYNSIIYYCFTFTQDGDGEISKPTGEKWDILNGMKSSIRGSRESAYKEIEGLQRQADAGKIFLKELSVTPIEQ